MKKILLILVGGTICTALNEKGTLTISDKASALLVENFKNSNSQFADTHFEITENLGVLSENMTVEKWNVIIDTYKRKIKLKNFDGVIFAHGTDTLAYSTSLFAQLLWNTKIPVFFVSSNKRISLENANGNDNFRWAVECICKGITPNVYAAYKNISDQRMYLHLGSRLLQCPNYSEDFHSVGEIDITNIDSIDFSKLNEQILALKGDVKGTNFDIEKISHLENCVLTLQPYVGVNYSAYNYKKFKAVLHGTYHSGTACAEKEEKKPDYGENSILYMIDTCKNAGVDSYFAPSVPTGEIYDTVRIIAEHLDGEIKFLYGTTFETAYAKLVIAYSLFDEKEKIHEFVTKENNCEFFNF